MLSIYRHVAVHGTFEVHAAHRLTILALHIMVEAPLQSASEPVERAQQRLMVSAAIALGLFADNRMKGGFVGMEIRQIARVDVGILLTSPFCSLGKSSLFSSMIASSGNGLAAVSGRTGGLETSPQVRRNLLSGN